MTSLQDEDGAGVALPAPRPSTELDFLDEPSTGDRSGSPAGIRRSCGVCIRCDRRGVDPTPDAARGCFECWGWGLDCVSHDGLVDALGELRESHDGHARDSVLGLLDDPIENPTLVESRRELLDDPIEGPTAARSGGRGFEVSVHEELARGSMSNPTGRAVGHVDGGHVDDPIETVWDDRQRSVCS